MTAHLPPLLALTVTFQTAEPQRLPPFLGSALHGGLGRALYRAVCAFPRRQSCPGCPLSARCAYPALFQTPAASHAALRDLGVSDQAPRPLVLAPEAGWTRPSGKPVRLDAGQSVPFRLTLVGRAANDLPLVTVALQALARRGIGIPAASPAAARRRAAAELVRLETADGTHVVYEAAGGAFTMPPLAQAVAGEDIYRLGIEFVSPVRLKGAGRIAGTVTPPHLARALARRANALNLLYGSGEPVADEARCAALAEQVVVADARLRRVHVNRYSSTQRRRMLWPGLMGIVEWRGEALRDLSPLLRFGELVQVGKGAALGFGRYRLVAAQTPA